MNITSIMKKESILRNVWWAVGTKNNKAVENQSPRRLIASTNTQIS